MFNGHAEASIVAGHLRKKCMVGTRFQKDRTVQKFDKFGDDSGTIAFRDNIKGIREDREPQLVSLARKWIAA